MGEYAKLLADIMYANPSIKKRFIKRMMIAQISDDKVDMIDDLRSQVNPFVALLAEHNLIAELGDYIARIENNDEYDDRYLSWFTPLLVVKNK